MYFEENLVILWYFFYHQGVFKMDINEFAISKVGPKANICSIYKFSKIAFPK